MSNYLYNGVPLPDIYSTYTPELQKTHPYAYVLCSSSGVYWLKCVDTAIEALSGGAFPPISSGKAFELVGERWTESDTTGWNYSIIWSNTDVYYSEPAGGGLFLAASDPVPVVTTPDPKYKLTGWLVGRRIAKQRAKGVTA